MPRKERIEIQARNREIVERAEAGESYELLATEYGVDHSRISQICRAQKRPDKRFRIYGGGPYKGAPPPLPPLRKALAIRRCKVRVVGDFPGDSLYLECSCCHFRWWQKRHCHLECARCAGKPEIIYTPKVGE